MTEMPEMTEELKVTEEPKVNKKTMRVIDIMLDLETLGLCDNAVITQLSAVAFSLDSGEILDTFDSHIGVKNSVQKGLKIDGSSVEWWFKQPQKNYEDVFLHSINLTVKLEDVLNNFTEWISTLKETFGLDYKARINMWGNGLLADNKWLRQAYKACNLEVPWAFYDDRDVRSLVELGSRLHKYDHRKLAFEGTVHNALDDCKHQIKYCVEIYKLFCRT